MYVRSGERSADLKTLRVRGLVHTEPKSIREAIAAGGGFVEYDYCVSVVVATWRGRSAVWFRRPGQTGRWRGLPYTLVSLLLGWWGMPWGFIYTPLAILTNLRGGRDVTAQVLPLLFPDDGNEPVNH